MREIESDRESERRNKERKRRIDLRRSAPNNDSRPRSVAREPRSREHLSVSLVPPREIPRLLRFANRVPELNWYAIYRKKKKSEGKPVRQENSVDPRRISLMIKDSVRKSNRMKWSKKRNSRNPPPSRINKSQGKTVKIAMIHEIWKNNSHAPKVSLYYSADS